MPGAVHQLRALAQDCAGAIRIAADTRSCARLLADFCLARVMRARPVRGMDEERHIRLRGGGTLTYRLNRSDIYTIHEVWIEEMYRLPADLKPRLFVDLGANIGLTSLWLARRYGCARMIAVEPSPANAAIARKNLEAGAFTARVIEAAAGSEDGTALFDAGPGATNGRVVNTNSSLDVVQPSQYPVRIMTMEAILSDLPQDTPIDLIKIDIEGGEQDLLTGGVDWLHRVRTIIIEFHPILIEYERLTAILDEAGFYRAATLCTNPQGGNTLEFWTRHTAAPDASAPGAKWASASV